MKMGRYKVLRELAQGGMAHVTLAESTHPAHAGRRVVIKRPLQDNPEAYDRLLDEAQAGARLEHPYIVKTLDFFTEDKVPHLVLGYVEGRSLLEVRQTAPLPADIVVRIGRQMSEALSMVHAAKDGEGVHLGMLHRDISPSNIVLGHDGDAHLIDLGIVCSAECISEHTRQGFLRGKVAYLAPELFFGRPYTVASDLWALGIVLLEAALGRRVVKGSQPEMTARIVGGNVMALRPGERLAPSLARALSHLLAPDPEQRTHRAQDAVALFRMLEHGHDEDVRGRAADAARGRLSGTSNSEFASSLLEGSESEIEVETQDVEQVATTPSSSGSLRWSSQVESVDAATGATALQAQPESGWVHAAEAASVRPLGRSLSLLDTTQVQAPMSVKDRLDHYVAELQHLSCPDAEHELQPMPPTADPWQMDSSPGT